MAVAMLGPGVVCLSHQWVVGFKRLKGYSFIVIKKIRRDAGEFCATFGAAHLVEE